MTGEAQEANRKEEELHEQLLRDKHRFLIDRLRADIRYFAHALQEFVDLPPESGRTWEQCIADMLRDVNSQEGIVASSQADVTLAPIVTLLNFRDRLLAILLTGALYQKALVDEELQMPPTDTGGADADKAAAELAERHRKTMADLGDIVRAARSRGDPPPEKLVLRELPSAAAPGYFTYEQQAKQSEAQGQGAAETSILQARMLAALREMQGLDRTLRQMKFGKKLSVSTGTGGTGKSIASDELRKEIAKLFDKCSRLEHELQTSKAQRHAALDVQIELNTKKCEDVDREIKKNMNRVVKLEGDVQALKAESAAILREKAELAEKNQKLAQEHLPVLDKLDKQLGVLRDSVHQLTADAEMLSQMFRLQVQENKKTTEERDEKAKELARVSRVLRNERLKNQLKDVELGKKETLYLRTTEARDASHASYLEGKLLIQDAEARMKQKEEDWEKMKMAVLLRDQQIAQLKDDMRRTTLLIDELEQQKKQCMKEFKAITGRPYAMLLEQYKVAREGKLPS